MRRGSMWPGLAAAAGMLALILDGKTALAGARAGVELCLGTVAPSLFPFFLLSAVLTGSLGGRAGVLGPLGRLFGMPRGAEALLITGFLGGYPVGARAVADSFRAGQLSRAQARRLLAFCSNAGPAFLFGMAGRFFPRPWMGWLLWAVHLTSALLTARLTPGPRGTCAVPVVSGDRPRVLEGSVRVLGTVCGWVVAFRVVLAFLDRWVLWLLPAWARTGALGALELTNGCCALGDVGDVRLRFVLCSGMLAFGGLCVAMQTASVIAPLPLRDYLAGKLLQSVFSVLLSWGLLYGQWHPIAVCAALFLGISAMGQKNSSAPAPSGV